VSVIGAYCWRWACAEDCVDVIPWVAAGFTGIGEAI
jgi:hypothetical protein